MKYIVEILSPDRLILIRPIRYTGGGVFDPIWRLIVVDRHAYIVHNSLGVILNDVLMINFDHNEYTLEKRLLICTRSRQFSFELDRLKATEQPRFKFI